MIIHITTKVTSLLSSRGSDLFYTVQKQEICLLNETVLCVTTVSLSFKSAAGVVGRYQFKANDVYVVLILGINT